MSNKPLKASDQKKLNELMKKKTRKSEFIEELPPYMYILSEGTKTEPNYINGIVSKINEKYNKYSSGERIKVKGTRRNTKGLLKYARNVVEKEFSQAEEVWIMYDKDDFPLDNFDNTQYSAENKTDKRKYRVAWSNECIELWFLLHFCEYNSNVGRDKYTQMLNKYFKDGGFGIYEKHCKNLYDILKDKTDIAINRAQKQYENYDADIPPSQRCPSTRVYELIVELKKYL